MSPFIASEQRPIVWVENSLTCRLSVRRALLSLRGEFGVLPELVWLHTSEDLIGWLYTSEAGETPTVPLIIFLDLALEEIPGLKLLGNLKHSAWRSIPIIVVSKAVDPVDVAEAWKQGAAGFVQLPVVDGVLENILRTTLHFYENSELPPIDLLRRISNAKITNLAD